MGSHPLSRTAMRLLGVTTMPSAAAFSALIQSRYRQARIQVLLSFWCLLHIHMHLPLRSAKPQKGSYGTRPSSGGFAILNVLPASVREKRSRHARREMVCRRGLFVSENSNSQAGNRVKFAACSVDKQITLSGNRILVGSCAVRRTGFHERPHAPASWLLRSGCTCECPWCSLVTFVPFVCRLSVECVCVLMLNELHCTFRMLQAQTLLRCTP